MLIFKPAGPAQTVPKRLPNQCRSGLASKTGMKTPKWLQIDPPQDPQRGFQEAPNPTQEDSRKESEFTSILKALSEALQRPLEGADGPGLNPGYDGQGPGGPPKTYFKTTN